MSRRSSASNLARKSLSHRHYALPRAAVRGLAAALVVLCACAADTPLTVNPDAKACADYGAAVRRCLAVAGGREIADRMASTFELSDGAQCKQALNGLAGACR